MCPHSDPCPPPQSSQSWVPSSRNHRSPLPTSKKILYLPCVFGQFLPNTGQNLYKVLSSCSIIFVYNELKCKLVHWEFFENSGILSKIIKISISLFGKRCSRTLPDLHNQTDADRAICFFFYWTTTDKLEFTDWSRVHRIFGCGKNVILWWRMMIVPSPPR